MGLHGKDRIARPDGPLHRDIRTSPVNIQIPAPPAASTQAWLITELTLPTFCRKQPIPLPSSPSLKSTSASFATVFPCFSRSTRTGDIANSSPKARTNTCRGSAAEATSVMSAGISSKALPTACHSKESTARTTSTSRRRLYGAHRRHRVRRSGSNRLGEGRVRPRTMAIGLGTLSRREGYLGMRGLLPLRRSGLLQNPERARLTWTE